VYDPKGLDVLPQSTVTHSDRDTERAIRAGAHRITYVPDRAELPDAATIVDRHVAMILSIGAAWCFLLHELGDIADARSMPPAIGEVVRKGAALGHVLLACYQRTVELPRGLVNNATHIFLFAVYDPEELDRAAAVMGDAVRRTPLPLPFDYSFWYRGPDGVLVRCAALK
jgi:hypothetical protein